MTSLQVVVIVSDGDHGNDEDPINQEETLKSRDVKIFTVGVGAWLKASILRKMATKHSYYAYRDDWKDMLEARQTTLRPGRY